MGKVSKRVTLLQATLFGDQLVAAGERYRLERDERDLLRILESETDDRTDLIVVNAVDQRGDENDVNARFVQVVDRTQLYVEQVADLAVRVGIVADTVELQINEIASPASAASRQNSFDFANSIPLVAACTEL